MISSFREGEASIWVPVAKGKGDGPARAFLPVNGKIGAYTYGYKAAPSTGAYFDALREIQESFINDEKMVFVVNSGKKKEVQRKARWRHDNERGAPLLGPSLGWVRVPLDQLYKVSGSELGKVIDSAGTGFAELPSAEADPVLCYSPETLERESARLYHENSGRVPKGQASPPRQEKGSGQFVRDAAVVAYVLSEAGGACECCTKPAPFIKPNGLQYLEVHHVRRLASNGSDKISNAVAVCPNCHRELHYGVNSTDLVDKLYSSISRLVRE